MQTIFLQAAADGFPVQLVMFGAIILVAYFFMIRPQQKKVKDQKKFRDELTKGMDVVTIGGLHGKIITVESDIVVLEVDKGIRLTFDKASISMEATTKVK
ncbi:preprotein translocase subunit YajC [Pontibacter beigongshangensis]|uniref:preprotein translocase subunit YajC n=1 Tax=Pontibacter beigongshangensis TaxID=2574733 RepID=UPI001650C98D|nr:preprotein translocase subunit YajC [Pontibacter beigongshangensis]